MPIKSMLTLNLSVYRWLSPHMVPACLCLSVNNTFFSKHTTIRGLTLLNLMTKLPLVIKVRSPKIIAISKTVYPFLLNHMSLVGIVSP